MDSQNQDCCNQAYKAAEDEANSVMLVSLNEIKCKTSGDRICKNTCTEEKKTQRNRYCRVNQLKHLDQVLKIENLLIKSLWLV